MKALIWLLLTIFFASGCGNLQEGAQEPIAMNETTVQTDVETLSRWFNLSSFPEVVGVHWVQRQIGEGSERLPGPTDYYVVAILEFDHLLAPEISLAPRNDVYVEDDLLESWMPTAVADRFVRTPEGYLKFDGTAYAAEGILVSPLTSGYVLVIENYLFIYGATG
jgi:hypothetical protein